jgi:hypothetical protein
MVVVVVTYTAITLLAPARRERTATIAANAEANAATLSA